MKKIRTSIPFSCKPSYTRLGVLSKSLDKNIGETLAFLTSLEDGTKTSTEEFLQFAENEEIYSYTKTICFPSAQGLWDLQGFRDKMDLPLEISIDLLIYKASKRLFQNKASFENFWNITSSSIHVKNYLV